MQDTQMGHFSVKVGGDKYNLTPSLRNMSRLASASRLIVFYDMMHSNKVPENVLIDLSREIILTCADSEEIDKHLIKCKRGKPHITKDSFSASDQVVVAAGLIRHGVAGVNRPNNAGSRKASGKEVTEFDVNRVVAESMIHFGLSRAEALDLTMSEFYQLLAAKYPQESSSDDAPTVKAYTDTMKEDEDMYKKALESLGVNNG